MNQIKISVIMPVYNGERYIKQSIEGILSQTYENFELIIIDDCSEDNTLLVIQSFNDSRISTIKLKKNSGVASARNVGLERASGAAISFCDADDIWYPEKLQMQVNVLVKNDAIVCHCNCNVINSDGTILGQRTYPSLVDYNMMRHRNFICNSGGLYMSTKIGKIFQETIFHEDYLMWLNILKKAKISYSADESLLQYRVHANNLSRNKIKSVYHTLLVQYKHGVPVSELVLNIGKNILSRTIK